MDYIGEYYEHEVLALFPTLWRANGVASASVRTAFGARHERFRENT